MEKSGNSQKERRKSTSLKSIVARHMIEKGHNTTCDNVYVTKRYGNSRKLNTQETLAILRELEGKACYEQHTIERPQRGTYP